MKEEDVPHPGISGDYVSVMPMEKPFGDGFL
jgi:hypothetical protein